MRGQEEWADAGGGDKPGSGEPVRGKRTLDGYSVAWRAQVSEKGFQVLPNGLGHDLFAACVGMDAVTLVKRRDAADAFEEEGNEGDVVFFRQFGKQVAELFGIGVAHIRWDLHAGKDDFGGRIFIPDRVDNGLKIIAGAARGDPAEPVVAAEFQDKDVNRLTQD